MADPKSLARVKRLLKGPRRPDDLLNLFLFARDRCDGREAVQEIGDFVAHHDERTKGIVTRNARDFFAITRFHAPSLSGNKPHTFDRLPSITPAYLHATARRYDHKITKEQCGMSKAQVFGALPGLISALIKKTDGTYSAMSLDNSQRRIISGLMSHIAVQPAFTGDRLFDDFKSTLKSNGLICRDDNNKFDELKAFIQLFAISVMHNSRIIMEDGTEVVISALAGANNLSVNASIPTGATVNGGAINLGADIFITNLGVEENCTKELQSVQEWREVEIEVDDSGRLSII